MINWCTVVLHARCLEQKKTNYAKISNANTYICIYIYKYIIFVSEYLSSLIMQTKLDVTMVTALTVTLLWCDHVQSPQCGLMYTRAHAHTHLQTHTHIYSNEEVMTI